MTRKTESLAYPADPLAAIRELHDLDAQPVSVAVPPAARRNETTSATALPRPPATGGAVVDEVGSEVGSATGSTRRHRPRLPEPAPRTVESNDRGDPLRRAVRELLARPYTADPKAGPFTVSTVKIPTEVWERLGWVSTLTGRPKQEILAEALKDHFEKILGEV
jgi:hypothetical protein